MGKVAADLAHARGALHMLRYTAAARDSAGLLTSDVADVLNALERGASDTVVRLEAKLLDDCAATCAAGRVG